MVEYLRLAKVHEVLVAFAYNDEHFDVDHDKSDKLPDLTSSHHSCEFSRDHC